MKLVIIDPDPTARGQLAIRIRSLGCKDILSCASGLEAIHAVERRPGQIGLVMCELQMPGMDGEDVLRHLARLDYRGRIALLKPTDEAVLHSALSLAQAHRLNVVGALQKPFNVEMLAGVVAAESWFIAHGERRHAHRGGARGEGRQPVDHGPDALRVAILRGQLRNVYQPKVDVRTGRVTGVEACTRWHVPSGEVRQPNDFIAMAEDNGLIDLLTQVVLSRALDQSRRWREQGLALDLAVNVSMSNVEDPSFAEMVAAEAISHDVPRESLTLQLAELQTPTGAGHALAAGLARLRRKRIRLSIDDFSMRAGSLGRLPNSPFDDLKIDGCFVHGASRDRTLRAIFHASCQVARHLRLRCVAEGVEDEADWNLVRASGCHQAQGNFFAPPMRGDEVAAWITEWNAARPTHSKHAAG